MSPVIVKKYNLHAGALKNINQAEKDLTASIMKRAEAEARAEMIKEKIKASMQAKESGGSGVLGGAFKMFGFDDASKQLGQIESAGLMNEARSLFS